MTGLTLLKCAGAGVMATLTMDLGSGALRALGLTQGVPTNFFGRWFGHLARGRLVHQTIAESPDLPGQMPLAVGCHYLIGVSLAVAFGLLLQHGPVRLESRAGAFGIALGFGLLTNLLPWLVMFPAMGFGWFGFKGPPEYLLLRTSFLNHLLFGVGLGISSLWVTSVWARPLQQ